VNTGPLALQGLTPTPGTPDLAWRLDEGCHVLDVAGPSGELVLFIVVSNLNTAFPDEWGFTIEVGEGGGVIDCDDYEEGVDLETAKRTAVARALSILESMTAALKGVG
jgi:hypothetical protein